MVIHQFEARCHCGATWRVYRDDPDDDPMSTCVNCGSDTYDLTHIGEHRNAGRDVNDEAAP